MSDKERHYDLSAESILADAAAQAGLDDFGDDSFREGLDVLLETYSRCGLSRSGAKRTRTRLVQLLVARLGAEHAWKEHPEILERPITKPIYLTGLPRTGTSILFNLLAEDPVSRPLLMWEGVCPDPLRNWPEDKPDPRAELIQAGVDVDRERNPDFDRIHYVSATRPEECVLLLSLTFADVQVGIEPLMEPYASWFQSQDLGQSYSYYANLLRLLDWQRPGERWLLKSPAHLWALDTIVGLFPDACVVQTHRNPLEILPSYCSMMAALMANREHVEVSALGPVVLEYLAVSLERFLQVRDSCENDPVLDLDYLDLVENPQKEIERVYEHFNLGMSDRAQGAMRDFLSANPQNKHGAHSYNLAEFGLSSAMVCDRLNFYIERFDLPHTISEI